MSTVFKTITYESIEIVLASVRKNEGCCYLVFRFNPFVGYAHCCRCDMIPTNGCNSDFCKIDFLP